MSKPTRRLQELRQALIRLREEETPPERLVVNAIALHDSVPSPVVLHLLAAAGGDETPCFKVFSPSGHWELGIYRGMSDEDRAAQCGFLLLRVNPEFRENYEGRIARIFVSTANDERVLAEEEIRDGELYVDISFAGLDLERRDAVNVIFKPRDKP
jgi:hypothetical protein